MDAKEEPEDSPPQQILSSLASPCSKKSRRSVQKRVVSVPVSDADGAKAKGGGEAFQPSDTWSWRKYGQKPIKGSPYPRGYYRCSSSKGCPARKQVERSRVDPTMIIVTYSSDHDHSLPISKNHRWESPVAAAEAAESNNSKQQEAENPVPSNTSPAAVQEKKLSDLMMEQPAGHMMPDDFRWFANVGLPSSTSPTAASDAELFYGPIMGVEEANLVLFDDCDKFNNTAVDEEEDALFAGLGELPECSVIFRRGFLERQWRGGEDMKRCGIEAEESAVATTSWFGSTR